MSNKKFLNQLFDASLRYSNNLNNLLAEYAKIGFKWLNSEGLTIFLMEDKNKKYGKLRIRAGAGLIGEKLFEEKSVYWVPKRPAFTERIQVDENIETQTLTWDQEVELIEDGKLPMGITACVVRTGESVHLTTLPDSDYPKVYQHKEHRGKYEDKQERKCQSVMMDPLFDSKGKPIGVLKAENKQGGGGFTPDDDKLFEILGIAVQIAIVNFESVKTYKQLFGIYFTKWFNEKIDIHSINGLKNKRIVQELKNFCEEVECRDIIGIENIYTKTIETATAIVDILRLPINLNKIIEEIYSTYEPLLQTDVKYREHFIHQFHVFLLGYSIINTNNFLRDTMINSLGLKNSDIDKLIKSWFLASIFHDMAYVIEKIPKWLGNFLNKTFGQVKKAKGKGAVQFQFNWSDLFRIEDYEYHKRNLIDSLSKKFNLEKNRSKLDNLINEQLFLAQNHGLFSALIMMNRLKIGLTNDDNEEYNLVKEAALAIATHTGTISGVISDIKSGLLPFNASPLAFLLMFCDVAQEWGRPTGLWIKIPEQTFVAQLDNLETEQNVNILLKYTNVPKKLAKFLSARQENWCLDDGTRAKTRLSIRIYNMDNNSILTTYDY